MHDQHHHTRPGPEDAPGPPDGERALWDQTVQALAAAGIDVVQAGDGRPGAVLELGPRGLGVSVRWQATNQAPLPGGVLAINVCRGELPTARRLQNLILEAHLVGAGLRTAYAGQHLAVVRPDVVIPDKSRPERVTAPVAPAAPVPLTGAVVPARHARRRRGWPARWSLHRAGR
ncbi:hypothetical protein ACPC54_41400 [Kitasatospora sp. NPDC094028]